MGNFENGAAKQYGSDAPAYIKHVKTGGANMSNAKKIRNKHQKKQKPQP